MRKTTVFVSSVRSSSGYHGLIEIRSATSTLLYPRLSVNRRLRLGTGWEPPIRGSEMFERFPRPNLTDFFHFFCKKHTAYPFPKITFFWACTKKFSPSKLAFFWGYHHFSKIEGPFPKLRVRAVRGSWALLLLLIIPALIQCFD